MKKVEIYYVDYCPYCKKALELLKRYNVQFDAIDITANEEEMRQNLGKMYNIHGVVTVPQIIIDGKRLGGYDTLKELEDKGEIEKLA